MINKRLNIAASTFILSLASLTGCVKQDLIDESQFTDGEIEITADWSNRGQGVNIPNNLAVVGRGRTVNVTGGVFNSGIIAPGEYRFLLFTTAERMRVDGVVATVETTDGIVNPNPGWFFSWGANLEAQPGVKSQFTATMQQQVRELRLKLKIAQGDPSTIRSVTSTLEGVATTLNLDKMIYGSPATIVPQFSLEDSTLTASVRMIGVVESATQKLSLTITYTDDSHVTASNVLNANFETFGKNKEFPITLIGYLYLNNTQTRRVNSEGARLVF